MPCRGWYKHERGPEGESSREQKLPRARCRAATRRGLQDAGNMVVQGAHGRRPTKELQKRQGQGQRPPGGRHGAGWAVSRCGAVCQHWSNAGRPGKVERVQQRGKKTVGREDGGRGLSAMARQPRHDVGWVAGRRGGWVGKGWMRALGQQKVGQTFPEGRGSLERPGAAGQGPERPSRSPAPTDGRAGTVGCISSNAGQAGALRPGASQPDRRAMDGGTFSLEASAAQVSFVGRGGCWRATTGWWWRSALSAAGPCDAA